jgi:hypothetical protein
MSAAERKLFDEGTRKRLEEMDEGFKKLLEGADEQREKLKEMKSAFDEVVDRFGDAMERMLNNGKFSFRELGAYFLREVKAGLIHQALEFLKNKLKEIFKTSSSSSGGGGIGSVLGSIIKSFPGKAGGGSGSGWNWVGEEGPELAYLGAGARVYNGRTMNSLAGAMGARVSIGGTNITIQGGDTSESTIAAVKQYVDAGNARISREFARTLQRNGVRRPR